ncbi:MAG: ABC transporter ATP-binding protein [Parcubacteria group bacterium]|nr:ABC transporter ATP-binding protein [Parcubacteria group bacterium]
MSAIISRVLINLAPDIISVFLVFAIVILIDPVLTVVLFGGLLTYIFAIIIVTPKYAGFLNSMHKAYNKAYGDAYDSVINVAAVKQAGAEKFEERKLIKNFKINAVEQFSAYVKIYSNLTFTQRLIVTLTQLTLFIISFQFIQSGRITIGELIAFNGYAAMIFGPFYRLGINWDLIQNGFIGLKRAEEILASPEEMYIPRNGVIFSEISGDVEFKEVYFKYGIRQSDVLQDITFSVRAGETIALVGESGVGKSTLIDLISYYYKPSRGKVFIDGHDISLIDLISLRSFIAVVAQEPILFNDTIKNNIRYGSFGAGEQKVKEAARLAHADEFIEKFNKKYNQVVGDRGVRLSAGQKQRIAIARAILRNPKILILDEPTSALDARNEKFISEALDILMKGRTTFIIAHRLSTVRKADKILVLEGGKIKEGGKHDELIKIPNGIYRRLYELQVGLK